jgi:hypothetical protein
MKNRVEKSSDSVPLNYLRYIDDFVAL